MQENKTLHAYRQGILHERGMAQQKARNVITAINTANNSGMIQSVEDAIEFIRVEFDLIDER